jgi:hypothetical protein
VKDVTDIRSYKSFVSDIGPHSVFNKSYKCGEKVEENLWKAWAKENDLYSGLWTVDKVDDSDTSNLVSLSVTPDGCSETLEFSFSIDEWDENPSMRKLVDTVGSGLVSNIENEVVWVSMGDAISADPVAVSGPWGLYCPSQKPNIVSRFMDRWNWI